MSEWFSLFLVFWALYLIDGLRVGRRERLHFQAFGGRLRARVTPATWHLPVPLPGAWNFTVDDLPLSLSPEGLTNWPAGSASRPVPTPLTPIRLAWEEISEVRRQRGWILVNGRRFCPVTSALDADGLQALVKQLVPLDSPSRAAALDDWERTRWQVTRLTRRLRLALGRSRLLATLNTLQTLLMVALTVYLLADGSARVSSKVSERIARAMPWWAAYYGVLHLVVIFEFRRLHKALFPAAKEERGNIIMTALLVPAQALRLRQHLLRPLAAGVHPLAAALAAGRTGAAPGLAANTLRDIDWPFLPADQLPAGTEPIVLNAGLRIRKLATSALAAANAPALSPETLLAAPNADGPSACAYCPRCGDQFIRTDSKCRLGVPLKPLG